MTITSDTQAALEFAEQHTLADTITLGHSRILVRQRTLSPATPGAWVETWAEHSTRDPNAPPDRLSGTTAVYTSAAFVDAVKHLGDGSEVIYRDEPGRAIVAVLNAPEANAPNHGDHRVSLLLRHPTEWQRWFAGHNKIGEQEAFARRIEDGQDEIVDPSAAIMLDVAQHFHASVGAHFRQGRRLDNGQVTFAYEERVDAKAGAAGDLAIPGEFTIAVAPFVGVDPINVTCRLRYEAKGGTLKIGYSMRNPEGILEHAFSEIADACVGPLAGLVLEAPAPS